MALSVLEQLMYATVRIECQDSNGNTSTGTGFHFDFPADENNRHPVIFTNKHVLENMQEANIILCLADESGTPLDKEHFTIKISDLPNSFYGHPDPSVDLCAIPTALFYLGAKSVGHKLFTIGLNPSIIPNQQQLNDLNPVESITMVGYPNGLWDNINNKPIFRRGTTATHAAYDYCGKKEFMIDCACYPGSSGSPILIVEPNSHSPKKGGIALMPRVYLLGILYAGPIYTANGDVKVVDIPTVQKAISSTQIMMNLGTVIKAERILEMRAVLGF